MKHCKNCVDLFLRLENTKAANEYLCKLISDKIKLVDELRESNKDLLIIAKSYRLICAKSEVEFVKNTISNAEGK